MLNRVSQFFWNTLRTSTRRLVLDWLLILIGSMALGGGLVYAYTLSARGEPEYSRGESGGSPAHAALFMQSVVTRDGALGWKQLCPDLQALLPQTMLIREANTQHDTDLRQGVTLSMQPLATHRLAKGDRLSLYLVTARKPDGWEAQRVYTVQTRSSGCVKDVKYQDL